MSWGNQRSQQTAPLVSTARQKPPPRVGKLDRTRRDHGWKAYASFWWTASAHDAINHRSFNYRVLDTPPTMRF